MNPLSAIPNNELTHSLWEKGKEQAIAEREWVVADKSREVVLNTVAGSFSGDSNAEAMRKARISKEYKDHIEKMGQLKFDVILARTKYSAIEFEIKMRINNSFQQREGMKAGQINT